MPHNDEAAQSARPRYGPPRLSRRRTRSRANIMIAGAFGGLIVGGLRTLLFIIGDAVRGMVLYGSPPSSSSVTLGLFIVIIAAVGGAVCGVVIAASGLLVGFISSRLLRRADLGVGLGAFVAGVLFTTYFISTYSMSTEAKVATTIVLGLCGAVALALEWNWGWCIGRLREKARRYAGGYRDSPKGNSGSD